MQFLLIVCKDNDHFFQNAGLEGQLEEVENRYQNEIFGYQNTINVSNNPSEYLRSNFPLKTSFTGDAFQNIITCFVF